MPRAHGVDLPCRIGFAKHLIKHADESARAEEGKTGKKPLAGESFPALFGIDAKEECDQHQAHANELKGADALVCIKHTKPRCGNKRTVADERGQ